MEVIQIGERREVCWDEFLMERCEGVRVQMHKPQFRNIVLECDQPWEGNVCGYFGIVKDDGRYRLYYRGTNLIMNEEGVPEQSHQPTFCYAESADGKKFSKVPLGKIPFWGTKNNNIFRDDIADNIYIFKDTNPDCPKEEQYKGLAAYDPEKPGIDVQQLYLFTSADGIHFEPNRLIADDGSYDSLNVAFWDDATKQYYLYYRILSGAFTRDGKWVAIEGITEEEARHCSNVYRDIAVRTSKDFKNWSTPRRLDYGSEQEIMEMYTNQVQRYPRAKHMFVGFPMRYVDRYKDVSNFPHLPGWKLRQQLIQNYGRSGTAMTDGLIMTSRDGYHFRRTPEAFMTAGMERGTNWYYGDGGCSYGMIETASDMPGAPNEISLYYAHDYRVNAVKLARYAVRLDGFFSWRCDYQPGRVLTKPFTFTGNELHINFSTSAVGYVRIRLLDRDGAVLEGYDSGKLFGDSVDRRVDFIGSLSDLIGKEVRMEISMSDADLYAFQFEKTIERW